MFVKLLHDLLKYIFQWSEFQSREMEESESMRRWLLSIWDGKNDSRYETIERAKFTRYQPLDFRSYVISIIHIVLYFSPFNNFFWLEVLFSLGIIFRSIGNRCNFQKGQTNYFGVKVWFDRVENLVLLF